MYKLFYKPDTLDCYTLIHTENYTIRKWIKHYYWLSFSTDIIAYCEHTEVVIDDNKEGIGEEVPLNHHPRIQYIIDNIF